MKRYVLMAVMVAAAAMGVRAQELGECGTSYLEAAMERERAQKTMEEQKARMEMEKEQELPPAQTKKGLVLHYSFGKGGQWGPGAVVKDLSGNGHDGKVEGDGLEVVRGIGKRGKAVRFDGRGDYIRVPRDAAFEGQEVTVAAWMKLREGDRSAGDEGISVLVFKRNTSFHCNEHYCFEIFPNHVLRATVGYPPMAQARVDMAMPLTTEFWHHVAMTFRDGIIRVYLDGEEVGKGYFPHQLNGNCNADLLVGVRDHEGYPLGRFGAFDLAELKIWNEALDAGRVSALYKKLEGRKGVASSKMDRNKKEEANPGLVLHYSFGKGGEWGPGAVVKDLSGNGHDGKVEGDGLEVVRGIGKRRKAVRFDGKGDYIRVPRDAALEPQKITVAAWVRMREIDRSAGEDGIGVLVFKRNTSFHDNEDYCCEIHPNHMPQAEIANPRGMHSRVPAGMAMAPDLWHHVVLTVGGGEIRFYLDGKQTVSRSHPYPQDHNTGVDLFVGTRDHAGYPLSHFGAFDLAELEIWNEVLDGDRVAALYRERAGREGVAKPEDNRNPTIEKPVVVPPYRTPPRVFPPWNPGKVAGVGDQMAAELKVLVDQGRRDRAASPEFLHALEGLVEKYRATEGGAVARPSDKLPLKPEFRGPGMPTGWNAVDPSVWRFRDGEARQVESRANTRYVLYYEPGMAWKDYEMRVKFESDKWLLPPGTSAAAVYVRYKGVDDAYRVSWTGDGTLILDSCEAGGKLRLLASREMPVETVKDGLEWRVKVQGEVISVWHGDKRVLEVRDGTHCEGTVGVESIHIPMKFSDVQVK